MASLNSRPKLATAGIEVLRQQVGEIVQYELEPVQGRDSSVIVWASGSATVDTCPVVVTISGRVPFLWTREPPKAAASRAHPHPVEAKLRTYVCAGQMTQTQVA
jgi:hypothetical protein